MTANQITLWLVPIVLLVVGVMQVRAARRRRKPLPPKAHGAHAPGPGYDAKEVARSKGAGENYPNHS